MAKPPFAEAKKAHAKARKNFRGTGSVASPIRYHGSTKLRTGTGMSIRSQEIRKNCARHPSDVRLCNLPVKMLFPAVTRDRLSICARDFGFSMKM